MRKEKKKLNNATTAPIQPAGTVAKPFFLKIEPSDAGTKDCKDIPDMCGSVIGSWIFYVATREEYMRIKSRLRCRLA